MESNKNIFEKLGLPKNPIMLAPLAGVSDHSIQTSLYQQRCRPNICRNDLCNGYALSKSENI